jgi:hypothetical protein
MSNRRIKKLTPALLKKLIKEEKQKIKIERRRLKENRLSKKPANKTLKNISLLKETKEQQKQLIKKFKQLYMLRKKLKRNLIKSL